jgi:hypothetical protein
MHALTPATFDFEAARRQLLVRAGAGFEGVVAPPFIVVTNAPPKAVRLAEETLAWARDVLSRFFPVEPAAPTPIWIFDNRQSLIDHVVTTSYSVPFETIYTVVQGAVRTRDLYNPWAGEIVSQYSGEFYGLRLRHELVHAYVEASLPDAPAWLNEGLAKYFEHVPRDKAGDIRATWFSSELFSVMRAIARDEVPSFERMIGVGYLRFHGADEHLHYGVSQYLVCWLADRGLLRSLYDDVRAHASTDPSGRWALEAISGRHLSDLQSEWERFMLETWRSLLPNVPPPS